LSDIAKLPAYTMFGATGYWLAQLQPASLISFENWGVVGPGFKSGGRGS